MLLLDALTLQKWIIHLTGFGIYRMYLIFQFLFT